MGNTTSSNKSQGMRDSYLFGLVTYIIQVFDETVAQYRTIADATTSITNRLKNCRRFSVQASPNPENRYFFNNTFQVLIRERYRDIDGIHQWSLVLQLTPASKIIQVNIYDPNKAPAFNTAPQNNEKSRESVTDVDDRTRQRPRNAESNTDSSFRNRNMETDSNVRTTNTRSIDNIESNFRNGNSRVADSNTRHLRSTGVQSRNNIRSERLTRSERYVEPERPKNNGQRIEADIEGEFAMPSERPQAKGDMQPGVAEFDLRKL